MGSQPLARRPRRKQAVILLLLGSLIGAMLLTPVGAHVGGTVRHLWTKHIRPKADVRYEGKRDVLYARVAANGTLGNKKGAVSVDDFGGGGSYAVIFNRNVSQCAPVATIADTVGGSGEITAEPYSSNANGIFLTTSDSSGGAEENAFNLVVICG